MTEADLRPLADVLDCLQRMDASLLDPRFAQCEQRDLIHKVLAIMASRIQGAGHAIALVLDSLESVCRVPRLAGPLDGTDSLLADTAVRGLRWTIWCADCADRSVEFDRSVCSAVVQVAAAVEMLPVMLDWLLNLEMRGKNELGILVSASPRPTRRFGKLHGWLCDRLSESARDRGSATAARLQAVMRRHLPAPDSVTPGEGASWFWVLRDLRTHLVHHPKSDLSQWRGSPARLYLDFTSEYMDREDERREISSLFRWFWGGEPNESGFMPLVRASLGVLEEGLKEAASLPL